MPPRLLIVSTLDSQEPFGAFTRPYYLGMHLSDRFDLCQMGIDCSAVDYAQSISTKSRGLSTYVKAVRQAIADFQPDIIYAQETLPAIAAFIACNFGFKKKPALVFDFHTLSANEYWTRLASTAHKLKELKLLVKTYFAQGLLVWSGKPVIGAGKPVVEGIKHWFGVQSSRIYSVGNGVPEDLLTAVEDADPYESLRPAKIVVVVAPKTFQFPSNDMSAEMAVAIAEHLVPHQDIHFVIVGREAKDVERSVPDNVSFTGFLPSRRDFVSHLQRADVGLLPFSEDAIAGGARNKSLDFLACKTLTVSTPEGMRGLDDFQGDRHLLVSDYSPEAIADLLLETCHNLESYSPLAEAATDLVKREYSWLAKAERIAAILNSTLVK